MKRTLLLFAAGLVLGFLARVSWPRQTTTPPGQQRAGWARVARFNLGMAVAAAKGEETVPLAAQALDPRAEAILKSVGLHPAANDNFNGPSWLYIGAPAAQVMKSAEFAELSIEAAEGRVDAQCAPLFVQLQLAPESERRIRRALAEMEFAREEIKTAHGFGRSGRVSDEVAALLAESDERFRQRIRGELGGRFEQFEAFFDSIPARAELAPMFDFLAVEATPLTPAQVEAVVAARQAEARDGVEYVSPAYGRFFSVPGGILDAGQYEALGTWMRGKVALQNLEERLERTRPSTFTPTTIYSRASGVGGGP